MERKTSWPISINKIRFKWSYWSIHLPLHRQQVRSKLHWSTLPDTDTKNKWVGIPVLNWIQNHDPGDIFQSNTTCVFLFRTHAPPPPPQSSPVAEGAKSLALTSWILRHWRSSKRIELWGIHTAQGLTPKQIPIGFCTDIIGIKQCECTWQYCYWYTVYVVNTARSLFTAHPLFLAQLLTFTSRFMRCIPPFWVQFLSFSFSFRKEIGQIIGLCPHLVGSHPLCLGVLHVLK